MPPDPAKKLEKWNESRVEPWQRKLNTGSFFCIVPEEGVVVYGEVLGRRPQGVRRVMTYAVEFPEGAEDMIHIQAPDLPLTRQQFELARELGWPCSPRVFQVLMVMGAVAKA